MRLLRDFYSVGDLDRAKEGPHPDGDTRESVGSALLAIDDGDGVPALQTGCAQGADSRDRGAPGGDHVLHQADAFARFEGTLEPVVRAVPLRLLADDQERQPGAE